MSVSKKQKLVFKKGIKTLHFPVLLPIQLNDGSVDVLFNPAKIVNSVLKNYVPRKRVEIDFIYKVGTNGTTAEVVLTKK